MTEQPEPDPPDTERLADAIDAYLQHRTNPGETDAECLARNQELEDLLAPMLAAAREEDAPPEARSIGPYRIQGELGRGGMGVVFRAEHTALRRVVALKVLPSLLSIAPRRVERFLREAAAVARLDHEGIVRVFDSGEVDGVFYYAMELVEGPSLKAATDVVHERCGGDPRRLPDAPQYGDTRHTTRIDEIAAFGRAIAEALHHAHSQGIVHRDVKPQNLLLGKGPRPRLLDFGLVKELDASAASQAFAGTPHYASPEQVEPRLHQLDGRCDVFSLGIVLYELATLRRPFDGASTASVLQAVVQEEPRTLRSFDPRIPRDFEAIVLRAIEKVPNARYPSAEALAADLGRFLRREAVHARRHSRLRLLARWIARHSATSTAIALAALLLVGGPTAAWWFSARARAELRGERDVAAANLAAARRSIQKLAACIAEADLPEAPRLQGFRLELWQEIRRGYDDLVRLTGASAGAQLLGEAGSACIHEGFALLDLRRAREAQVAFARALELGARQPRTGGATAGSGDAGRRALHARALTGRGLAHYFQDHDGEFAADFAAARESWCELGATPGALRGALRTELSFAELIDPCDPAAAQASLERARAILARLGAAEEVLAIELQILTAQQAADRGDLARAKEALACSVALVGARLAERPSSLRLRSLAARQSDLAARLATTPEEGEARSREAVAAQQQLCLDFPDIALHGLRLLAIRDRHAQLLLRAGRFEEALAFADESLVLAADLVARDNGQECLFRLAAALSTFGVVAGRSAQSQVRLYADEALNEACRMLRYLVAQDPRDLRFHSHLGAALSNRAQLLLMQRQNAALASRILQGAIRSQRVAVQGAPKVTLYRGFLENHTLLLVEACFRSGQTREARRALDELVPLVAGDGDRLVAVAAGLARCAGLGEAGAADSALEVLARLATLDAGGRVRALADDPRFAALRDDRRFAALVSAGKENGR